MSFLNPSRHTLCLFRLPIVFLHRWFHKYTFPNGPVTSFTYLTCLPSSLFSWLFFYIAISNVNNNTIITMPTITASVLMALVKNEKSRRGEIRWGHEVYCDSLGARHEFSHPCKAFHKTTLQWTLQFSDGSGSKLPRHSSLSQTPLSRFVHSRDVNATSVHSRYTLTGSTHSHDTSTITTGMSPCLH